jgi:hypothetical protein
MMDLKAKPINDMDLHVHMNRGCVCEDARCEIGTSMQLNIVLTVISFSTLCSVMVDSSPFQIPSATANKTRQNALTLCFLWEVLMKAVRNLINQFSSFFENTSSKMSKLRIGYFPEAPKLKELAGLSSLLLL